MALTGGFHEAHPVRGDELNLLSVYTSLRVFPWTIIPAEGAGDLPGSGHVSTLGVSLALLLLPPLVE